MNGGLTRLLELDNGGVAAVVGCGGKTSLIRILVGENAGRKVLVSPTTQMFPPVEGEAVCADVESCESRVAQRGVVYMGVLDRRSGKLGALPPQFLEEKAKGYELTLLEADGSRMLPLKGWRENEPVVPAFCTHTVGVLPVWPLGRPARDDIVQRLPLFLELTGLREEDPVTVEALANMVCAPGGMFKNAVGKRFLVVNQVEDAPAERDARELLAYIAGRWPGRFSAMLYGSAREDRWRGDFGK